VSCDLVRQVFREYGHLGPDVVYGTEADEGRRRAEARRRVTEVLSFQDLQGPLVLPGVYLASGQPVAQYLLRRVHSRLWGSKDARDPLPRIGTAAEHDPYQQGGDRYPKDNE